MLILNKLLKKKDNFQRLEKAKFNAWFVSKGYSQVHGVDYNDVFSYVVKHSFIYVLFALVVMHYLELEWLEVKTTFLYGVLKETSYMQQLKGFKIEGKEDYVCLLKKIITWFEIVSSIMV